MKKIWPTQDKDMHIAELIMEEYAKQNNSESLGLFELVVDQEEKKNEFRLASWVLVLAKQFTEMYGVDEGDQITRLVISRCMTQGQTVH